MSQYKERETACLWQELKHVYPELAPPKEEREAELDKIDLFGPEEEKEKERCLSKD